MLQGEKMKDEFLEKARRALNKRSKYGLDVDVSKYVPVEPNMNELSSLKEISPELEKVLRKVGIDVEEKKRIGSYLQVDQKSIYSWSSHPGVEVLSLSEAVQLDWFKEYFWNAVPADLDKYTALTAIYGGEGYVIRVKKNVKVDMPVQACLIVKGRRELQTPHNIIIAEEGSRLHVVTGCTVAPESFGLHTGISEFYIGRKATVTFTMIHSWNKATHVRPRTGVIVEEEGKFISHYVNVGEISSLQTFPKVRLSGSNSTASLISTIVGKGSAMIDVGGEIIFEAENCRGEVSSRNLAKDNSSIIARSRLKGLVNNVKGHTECQGLLISNEASITAIPELVAKARDVELTHEAAIGRIEEDEIFYLMSRGLSREEATSLIVKGFLEVKVEGIPEILSRYVSKVLEKAASSL